MSRYHPDFDPADNSPSRCRSGRSCVAFDALRSESAPTGPGRSGAGPLCPGCVNRGRFDVGALPGDFRILTAMLAPGGPDRTGRITGGDTDAPVPVALGIEALRSDIVWALTVWEPPVREAAGLADPVTTGVRDVWVVDHAASLLVAHIDTLARLGPIWGYADGLDAGPVERDGVYAIGQFTALHQAVQRVAGTTPRTLREPGPCRCCGAPALTRPDGGDTVTCRVCDDRRSLDAYRRDMALMGAAGTGDGPLDALIWP